MVSFTVYKPTSGGAYVEGVCLATDEKPIAGITNGSVLFAVDTTDGSLTRYMFDQNSATWVETECPCSGGGSGSGGSGGGDSGSGGPLVVNISGADQVADKTFGEIKEALETGRGAVTAVTTDSSVGYYTAAAVYNDGSLSDPAWYVIFVNAPNTLKTSKNENAGLTDYPFFNSSH